MRIGEHEVTAVTKNSAKVGCTAVSRTQVEELLDLMDKAKNFVTVHPSNSGDYLNLELYCPGFGFVSVDDRIGFRNERAKLCLSREQAMQLHDAIHKFVGIA